LKCDESFLEKHLDYVSEFTYHTGGMNGFLYPLCLYVADNKDRGDNTIVTGYCGSELLRNAHRGGAVTAQLVIDYLKDKSSLEDKIKNYEIFVKNSLEYNEEIIGEVISELDDYFDALPKDLSVNQKLGIFEFEESMPKIFGSWIYSGMHFQRIRVPFMDQVFLEKITKTQISQFYREFLEQNPLRRFYGQLMYSKIIDRTYPKLGRYISGKGYSPKDLLSFIGRVRITFGYFKKNMKAKKQEFDNLALISGAIKFVNETFEDESIRDFYISRLNDSYRNEILRDSIFNELSLIEYDNLLKIDNKD
ncbi:MAG: hypothetical protein P9L91_10895, partial [Candidatus Zophobacter franzmannii]|nr:hypothetical protein [Candidatus Zophobacter franzmannii]